MNYTINQQLTRLESIKSALKNAINTADPSHLLTSDRFEDFASHISSYLGPKQQPVTQYTVTFNTNGGSGTAPSAQTVNAGSQTTLPSYTGTKSGYTQVSGWSTSSSATTATYSFGQQITVNNNMTLYAVFKENAPAVQYTLTLNKNNSTGTLNPESITVDAGTQVALPSYTGTKEHYTQVSGWATSASATTATYAVGQQITVNSNITLYAVFTINQHTVAWTNPSGGGTITAKVGSSNITSGSTKVNYNATVNLTYTKPSGRTVSAITWNKGSLSAYTTTSNTGATFLMPDANVTGLTANVTLVPQVTVTVNSNDTTMGNVRGGGTFDVGSTRTITARPNTGYVFVKWNDNDTNASRTITVPSSAITYTATFAVQGAGEEFECFEYVCSKEDYVAENCFGVEKRDFQHYKEQTVKEWFDITNLKLKGYENGTWEDYGKLTNKTYSTSTDGVNITDSNTMYWIAIPSKRKIKSFIMNYGTNLPEDIITKFDPESETHKLYPDVILGDGRTYNLYGLWVGNGTYTNKVRLYFQ